MAEAVLVRANFKPNLGKWELTIGKSEYMLSPDDFRSFVSQVTSVKYKIDQKVNLKFELGDSTVRLSGVPGAHMINISDYLSLCVDSYNRTN